MEKKNISSETASKATDLSAKLKKMREDGLKTRQEKQDAEKKQRKLDRKLNTETRLKNDNKTHSTFKIKIIPKKDKAPSKKGTDSSVDRPLSLPTTPKDKHKNETNTTPSSCKKKRKNLKSEAELKKKREKAAAKKRRQREKIRLDPVKLEKYKEYERKQYLRKKTEGKIKPIKQRSRRQQRVQRKRWRKNNRAAYNRKKGQEKLNKFMESRTPPESEDDDINLLAENAIVVPKLHMQSALMKQHDESCSVGPSSSTPRTSDLSRQAKLGRKTVSRYKSKTSRLLSIKAKECDKLAEKRKKKYYRLKKKMLESATQYPCLSPSPGKEVAEILNKGDVDVIKKKLLFGEVLSKQIENNKKMCSSNQEKQSLAAFVSGPLIKKYKLMSMANKLTSTHLQRQKLLSPGQKLLTEKRKNRTVAVKVKQAVYNFLVDDDNSVSTPGKKTTITKNGSKKQKRLLTLSLVNLHKKFKSQTNLNISYNTFRRLKPFWVVTPKLSARDTCLCVKHENFKFILQKLHQYEIITSASILQLAQSLCCGPDFRNCIYRICEECKDTPIPYSTNYIDKSNTVFYYKWVSESEKRIIKGKELSVKVTSKKKMHSTVGELTKIFEGEISNILSHVYRVWHQNKFAKTLKDTLNNDEVSLIIDFSENYAFKYSREIQSMHFGASKRQLSLHTGAFYYKGSETNEIQCQTFCSVSSCLRHDPSGIWAHLKPIVKLIRERLPNVEKLHIISDGPTTQYRNKTNFYLLTYFCSKFQFKSVSWNFSESGHGKSVADGIGGLVKRTADQNVARGEDVSNLEEFVDAVKNVKSTIFVIKEESMQQVDRLLKNQTFSAIRKTMQIHQLVWNESAPNTLYPRDLSCIECRNCTVCHHHAMKPDSYCFSKNLQADYSGNVTTHHQDQQDNGEVSASQASNGDRLLEQNYQPKHGNQVDEAKSVKMENLTEGAWLAVIFNDEWYPGYILSKNDKMLTIKFMQRSKNVFLWPSKDDLQTIPEDGVLCLLDPPVKVSSRHFKFDNHVQVDELRDEIVA